MTIEQKADTEAFIEKCGGIEYLTRRWAQSEKDREWLDGRRQELFQRYGVTFVAVLNETVVGVNQSLFALVDSLRQRGIDPTETVHEYITDQELEFIL